MIKIDRETAVSLQQFFRSSAVGVLQKLNEVDQNEEENWDIAENRHLWLLAAHVLSSMERGTQIAWNRINGSPDELHKDAG